MRTFALVCLGVWTVMVSSVSSDLKCATSQPLGMQNNAIPNAKITASSQYDNRYAPWKARLNTDSYGWTPKTRILAVDAVDPWLQVDLSTVHTVDAIATQGSKYNSEWMKSYSLQYSSDGSTFEDYKAGFVFKGNTDKITVVKHDLEPPVKARYIRVLPKTGMNGWPSMRIELYGCKSADQEVKPNANVTLKRIGCFKAKSDGITPLPIKLILTDRDNTSPHYSGTNIAWDRWNTYLGDIASRCAQKAYELGDKIIGIQHYGECWSSRYDKWNFSSKSNSCLGKNFVTCSSGERFCVGVVHELFVYKVRKDLQCQKSQPLGMQSNAIPNSKITASSQYDNRYAPWKARLNTDSYGWTPKTRILAVDVVDPWLQVDLSAVHTVDAIATQGSKYNSEWMKSYRLQYSSDGSTFEDYKAGFVFNGNTDKNTLVKHRLNPPVKARYIRVLPKTGMNGWPSMRMELYGCKSGVKCQKSQPLGMQSNAIPNSKITASSQYDNRYAPWKARLNTDSYGWTPKTKLPAPVKKSWLQVDLSTVHTVDAIATQGSKYNSEWMKSYRLQYSSDGSTFEDYKAGFVFSGNTDKNSVVRHNLKPPINARFIRVLPKTGMNGWPSMRMELYGCT